jgi:hypothetical protein
MTLIIIFWEQNETIDVSEYTKNNFFSIVAKTSKSCLSAELGNMKTNKEAEKI